MTLMSPLNGEHGKQIDERKLLLKEDKFVLGAFSRRDFLRVEKDNKRKLLQYIHRNNNQEITQDICIVVD